jgi:hypothetical protein
MRPLRLLALASLTLLASAVPASAKTTVAPPGNSGVQQYLEVVPSAGGDRPPSHRGGSALTKHEARRLDAQGADGRALRQIIDASAPDAVRQAAKRSRHRSPAGRVRPSASGPSKAAQGTPRQGSSVLSSAAKSLSTGAEAGGMGLLLPVLLIGSAGAIGGIALLRRRA